MNNNSDEKYMGKYLKYKKKYLEFKKTIGDKYVYDDNLI